MTVESKQPDTIEPKAEGDEPIPEEPKSLVTSLPVGFPTLSNQQLRSRSVSSKLVRML